MNSRIVNVIWHQIAQNLGVLCIWVCSHEKAVYLNNQGSSLRTSFTPWLAALLVKAEADHENYRSSKRFEYFISPLLGSLHFNVGASFFDVTKPVLRQIAHSLLTKHGVSYV